ncbi:copper chaperone PCu(A)C [Brevundimonas sp.]|uniref:copper chaperone PCu(A)C n=1 Tax=Brevundimonas sp. TaxID=1871086 RepID=UPI002D5A558A|nr:copper chaperone PCu(A)C [Brevundimonas sp.]HYC67566.1 copper chaperone PCu(A)C [Brevundimonas sp.]
MVRAQPFVILTAFAGALAACSPGEKAAPEAASTVQASGALCRPTPPGRQTTGCYLTLTSAADDRLMGITSPVAGRVQVHESRIESNMMMMHEVEGGLPLLAGQAVELKPGGDHIMLLGVAEPLKAGDAVPLTLTFASAAPIEVSATVGQPATTDYGHAAH